MAGESAKVRLIVAGLRRTNVAGRVTGVLPMGGATRGDSGGGTAAARGVAGVLIERGARLARGLSGGVWRVEEHYR